MNTAERIGNPSRQLTSSVKWLNSAAEALETGAEESLKAWIILGLSHRYSETMGKAAVLRRAASIKSIAARRHFLRENGVEA
jgi:hypothetical protein